MKDVGFIIILELLPDIFIVLLLENVMSIKTIVTD